MKTEYEATFTNIDKEWMRSKLKESGAILVRPEFLQRRVTFNLPNGVIIQGGWLRVRDEGDKITLSLKAVHGDGIESQKEILLTVDDFNQAAGLLTILGCKQKSYQETKRELWKIGAVEITIDEWPFLEPFVEVEGSSEAEVKSTSELLGFDYNDALFCAVGTLYSKKYGIEESIINNKTPKIVFDMENPFLAT
ncbi:MAG: adenylyl cyclase [Candidatus Ryanbacteria bacterium CG10_big_fil_rev_8_21_14_0_10_43_42]|uniref:Adenylyl cyclase n=1 Tax=Candidatus Ryanbacteria bacterium CG10_big_fil_rev_8_21_14_0_10_43_42 TaxID=1974864 RepID=A0A2M8KX43_9BACT|nr:MAG: adenylyl cyclase [Candidatus Ryanbacteria bacterium CG10_big_fil_rev_8_21_14_0_10_43_42]